MQIPPDSNTNFFSLHAFIAFDNVLRLPAYNLWRGVSRQPFFGGLHLGLELWGIVEVLLFLLWIPPLYIGIVDPPQTRERASVVVMKFTSSITDM